MSVAWALNVDEPLEPLVLFSRGSLLYSYSPTRLGLRACIRGHGGVSEDLGIFNEINIDLNKTCRLSHRSQYTQHNLIWHVPPRVTTLLVYTIYRWTQSYLYQITWQGRQRPRTSKSTIRVGHRYSSQAWLVQPTDYVYLYRKMRGSARGGALR